VHASLGLVALIGVFVGGAILGAPVGMAMLASGIAYLFVTGQDRGLIVDQTMNSLYSNYVLLAVPLFIFVANTMNASGVTDRLLDLSSALVGRFRGGLAQVNVLSNLVFSGMSGSAVADAAGPGLIIARMMVRKGYSPGFSAATSAAAATIGPIVPPSIPMVFYALIANTSVGAMFLGGLVPAGLMALSLMAIIAILSRRRSFPREAPIPLREWPATIGRAFLPMMLPVILLGVIYSGIATPTDAAAIAAAYALLLAYVVYRSARWAEFVQTLVQTVRSTASVGLIIAGAFVFNYAIASENVPQALQAAILHWNPSPLMFLAGVNVLFLALACVLDAITMLLVLVPLLVPVAVGLHIDPVFFGVLVILNMMIGLALPPHGLILYVMSSLTGTPVGDIFREVLPFIVALLVVLVLVTLVPDLVLALPRHFGYTG
jgi:tripartite ATP-independent transporter DctM subunit